jgi:outer membrane protein TolC
MDERWETLNAMRFRRRARRVAHFACCSAIFALGFAPSSRAQDAGTARKLTLKEAVSLAMQNSRDIALARLQYGLVQREAGVARSSFLPNFYTGTGLAYSHGSPFLTSGGTLPIFTLSYDQQIFNSPMKGEQHAAEQRAEGQRFSVEGVRDGVMVKAALEYLELAKVRHELELLRSERLSASHILDSTRERSEAGRELPIEVTRAELTSAKIEQRIAQVEDRDDSLSGELRDMMGIPMDQPIEVLTEDISGAALDQSENLVSQAMAENVELKEAEAEKRAREAKLKGEHGGYWPTVSLVGQYNLLSDAINNYSAYVLNFQRNNFIFGLQVKIPIFASRTSAAVAFARSDLSAANLALENKRSELSQDVRRQARLVREADLGGDVARLELQLAQENVRVLQAQYDQGRGSLKDLEAAHLDENDKWLAFLDANYARQQAQLNLLRTTGQLSTVLQ